VAAFAALGDIALDRVVKQRKRAAIQVNAAALSILPIATDSARNSRCSGGSGCPPGSLGAVVLEQHVRQRHIGVIDQQAATQRDRASP
jgi:hypothetical protein